MVDVEPTTYLVLLLASYLVAIFGGGWAVGAFLARALAHGQEVAQDTAKVGLYIGWFERFLAVTFLLTGQAAAVGLIVAAKSILRFSETKADKAFAERVLVGTLASISIAVAVGVAARLLIGAF